MVVTPVTQSVSNTAVSGFWRRSYQPNPPLSVVYDKQDEFAHCRLLTKSDAMLSTARGSWYSVHSATDRLSSRSPKSMTLKFVPAVFAKVARRCSEFARRYDAAFW